MCTLPALAFMFFYIERGTNKANSNAISFSAKNPINIQTVSLHSQDSFAATLMFKSLYAKLQKRTSDKS